MKTKSRIPEINRIYITEFLNITTCKYKDILNLMANPLTKYNSKLSQIKDDIF